VPAREAGLAVRAAGLGAVGDPVIVMAPCAFVRTFPVPGAIPIIEGVGPAFGAAAAPAETLAGSADAGMGTTPSGMPDTAPTAGTVGPTAGTTVPFTGIAVSVADVAVPLRAAVPVAALAPAARPLREPAGLCPRVEPPAAAFPATPEAADGFTSTTVVPRNRSRTSMPRLISPSLEAAGAATEYVSSRPPSALTSTPRTVRRAPATSTDTTRALRTVSSFGRGAVSGV
jgi:hypothetical protein